MVYTSNVHTVISLHLYMYCKLTLNSCDVVRLYTMLVAGVVAKTLLLFASSIYVKLESLNAVML